MPLRFLVVFIVLTGFLYMCRRVKEKMPRLQPRFLALMQLACRLLGAQLLYLSIDVAPRCAYDTADIAY